MAYNTFYTSIPVLVSALDKDLSERTVMQHPQILFYCQAGRSALDPRHSFVFTILESINLDSVKEILHAMEHLGTGSFCCLLLRFVLLVAKFGHS